MGLRLAALPALLLWGAVALGAPPLVGPGLGRPLDAAAAASEVIFPDGRGLPAGSGTVTTGEQLYRGRCQRCHGVAGRGGSGGELAGGNPDLTRDQPDLVIGTYWPYATTLFDFIRRAMPLDAPRSLSDDEVYALCAYLLHLNGLLGAEARLDAAGLRALVMPNVDGFIGVDAPWPAPRGPAARAEKLDRHQD